MGYDTRVLKHFVWYSTCSMRNSKTVKSVEMLSRIFSNLPLDEQNQIIMSNCTLQSHVSPVTLFPIFVLSILFLCLSSNKCRDFHLIQPFFVCDYKN